jgi:hypothetical protein
MQNPRVKKVRPLANYLLELIFDNGEIRLFDASPYLSFGIFTELRDQSLFKSVTPFMGGIKWQNNQDFCPDTLYEESAPIDSQEHVKNKILTN